MKWDEFIKITGDLPFIGAEDLLVGGLFSNNVHVQISRWQKIGKLIKLKKGIYVLSEPYRRVAIYEPYLASILQMPSYISLEKALEYHGLIPDTVPVYTSITTKRTGKFVSNIGSFDYRHIKVPLFFGYNSVVLNKQMGFIASPEKALLDLFYLRNVVASAEYLEELRLQHLDKISLDKLFKYAARFEKPKILYAAKKIKEYIISCQEEKTL